MDLAIENFTSGKEKVAHVTGKGHFKGTCTDKMKEYLMLGITHLQYPHNTINLLFHNSSRK